MARYRKKMLNGSLQRRNCECQRKENGDDRKLKFVKLSNVKHLLCYPCREGRVGVHCCIVLYKY